MTLVVSQISKQYGCRQALDNLSFSVGKGEIVGLIGSNGAGKTTAMKIIAGCIAPDRGSVTVGGYDIRSNPLHVKKLLGFLPENNPLYDDLYVSEYIEYVAGLYAGGVVRDRVAGALQQTGLRTEAHRKIGRLSKGYRQRVGLAQAMVHDPELLILDEPASGLDPNQADEMNRLLRQISAGKAILFSSHALQEVQSVCTRILIIHRGRILLDKPSGEIGDLSGTFRDLTAVAKTLCRAAGGVCRSYI